MSEGREGTDWLVKRPGLTTIALFATLFAFLILQPYLQYVLFGVVLAYILLPVQHRVERYVRPTFAAILVVVATLLVVLIPLIYLIRLAIVQGLGLVRAVRQGEIDVETIEEVLASNGYAVDLVELYEANQDRIASGLQDVTNAAINVVGGLPSMFIGLTITLFVLFGLLRDGERLVAWIQWVLPVEDEVLSDLREGLDELMWASVVGNVAVAAIQAVMLGAGLFVAGVPSVIFLTVATFVLTLLPLVGAFGVWIPAAAYLVAVGRPTAGAAIALYGLLVTFSDSYLRPALIGSTGGYNSVIVIVGIFGGLVTLGPVGLFLGPVVLGGAKLTLDSFARARTGEEPPGSVEFEEGSAIPEESAADVESPPPEADDTPDGS